MELTPQLIVTLIGCGVATATDWRDGKIYNRLTFPMMALGLVMNASLGQWAIGVYGLLVATAVHVLLYNVGVQKAGDSKLLMGVGALMGWRFMVEASAWYAILYVPVGLFILWRKRRLGNLVKAYQHTAAKAKGMPVGNQPTATTMIAGPIIAAGVVLAALTDFLTRLI